MDLIPFGGRNFSLKKRVRGSTWRGWGVFVGLGGALGFPVWKAIGVAAETVSLYKENAKGGKRLVLAEKFWEKEKGFDCWESFFSAEWVVGFYEKEKKKTSGGRCSGRREEKKKKKGRRGGPRGRKGGRRVCQYWCLAVGMCVCCVG